MSCVLGKKLSLAFFSVFLGGVLASNAVLAADQSLLDAVQAGDHDTALALIRAEAGVNTPSADGTTPLHWAVYNQDVELVERLIQAGADVSAANDYGSSPMGEAATVGHSGIIALLLAGGVDADSPNPEGQTALMAVARSGNLDAAKLLVDAGADVNSAELWGGQTALMWASSRQHDEVVDLLLDHGALVDTRAIARDWDRRVTSEPRVKEMLTGGFTALLYAVREDCLACVKSLLESGADINKPDPDGVSALILALLNLRFDIAKHLVEAGADINQWDFWGRTPLFAATDTNILPASTRGDIASLDDTTGLDVARMLLERGANPNLQLKLSPPPRNIVFDRGGDNRDMTTGSTPLQRASYGGDADIIDLLLEFDANVELANINGISPILALAGPGGSRGRGKTEANVIRGMQALLEAGADINSRNNGGATVLHSSIRLSWGQVVRFLAEQGANLNVEDSAGLTPMDYATGGADSVAFGNFNVVGELPEMVALLEELLTADN